MADLDAITKKVGEAIVTMAVLDAITNKVGKAIVSLTKDNRNATHSTPPPPTLPVKAQNFQDAYTRFAEIFPLLGQPQPGDIDPPDLYLQDLDLGLITSVSIGALYTLTTGYGGKRKALDLFQDIIFLMAKVAKIQLNQREGCLGTECLK